MGVIYNGRAIIPGPFCTIRKEVLRSEDGRTRRRTFTITLKGKLVAFQGSPLSDGSFWTLGGYPPDESIPATSRLAAIRAKQGALVNLFATSGQVFEIQPFDGTASIKCNAWLKGDIEFSEGNWAETCVYTITLEANNVLFGNQDGGGGIGGIDPDETWSVEVANENTHSYRVTHAVSSQQKRSFNFDGTLAAEGWQNARTVVNPKLGPASADVLAGVDMTNYSRTNYGRVESVDEAAGKYAVTESWVYVYGGAATEEFTASTRVSAQDGVVHCSVEGTVTGYAAGDALLTPPAMQAAKFVAAVNYWNTTEPQLLTRAQNYAGVTMNPTALNKTVGRNPITGVITYSYEYDNRPPSVFAGSLSEVISVSNDNPADVFASLAVLGKADGPVLQSLGTKTAKTRSVNIEIVVQPATYSAPGANAPNLDAVVAGYKPTGALTAKDTDNWTPRTGRYSRNVSWTYV